MGYCRNQLDIKMNMLHDLALEEDKLSFQQRFGLDMVVKMGSDYNVRIQNSNIHLDFQKLNSFLGVVKSLLESTNKLLSFFSSKSYQIESSAKLGMVSLKSGSNKTEYFYAFDGVTIYLYSYTQ